jgi:hypothetical protein
MDVRPLEKILMDDDLNQREKFEEFVESRAMRWSVRNATEEEIDYLTDWAGEDDDPDPGDEIQAPGSLAREVGLSGATYGEIARRMLDPTAEW